MWGRGLIYAARGSVVAAFAPGWSSRGLADPLPCWLLDTVYRVL